jgi:hypothetical protein
MKAEIKTQVSFSVKVELTEREVMALDALAGYGHEAFLKVFYKHLGIHYIRPFEKDLIQLFEKIKELRPAIHEIKEARKKLGLEQLNP